MVDDTDTTPVTGMANNATPWSVRRRIVALTLIYCGCLIGYIAYKGTDSHIFETLASSAFFLAGTIISAYVFSATYKDVKLGQ